MGDMILFRNILGDFQFDSNLKLVGKGKDGREPTQDEIKKILANFKKNEFYSQFCKKNLEITKKSISESVQDDQLIIQAINNIEELNRVTNTLSKRLREWYELYNPETSNAIEDHEKFIELILKKSKSELLKELNLTPEKSMGTELKQDDLKPVLAIAKHITQLYEAKDALESYLKKAMQSCCPNLLALAGDTIGARLIEQAGSLKKLVLFPASTIQLLGAEKALFRHIKTGARCPKYGILINHPLISSAKRKMHGKIARSLADKISIAVKVDYYKGEFIGDKLRKQLEAKFK